MEFITASFLLVPTILFVVIVAPLWIVMHYRSVSRSSRSLNEQDREAVEHLLATADKLVERIDALESILDAEHSGWRAQNDRDQRFKE